MSDTPNAPGHNLDPRLLDRLPDPDEVAAWFRLVACAGLAQRAAGLAAKRAGMPKADNPERAGLLGDYVVLCRALLDAVEKSRADARAAFQRRLLAIDAAAAELTADVRAAGADAEDRIAGWLADAATAEWHRRQQAADEAADTARIALVQSRPDAAALAHAAEAAREHADRPLHKLAAALGDYGTRADLRSHAAIRLADRDAVDLERLRPFLDDEALEKAARAAAKAGHGLRANAVPKGFTRDDRLIAVVRSTTRTP